MVVIAGGGTGGHLFPGMAVAEELKKRDEKAEIMFIGTEGGIESRVIPMAGYPIRYLRAGGMLGKSPLRKAASAWKLLVSVSGARAMFRVKRPDVVVGTGGYVSAAPVMAARSMSIPSLIMEQNIVPGLSNRLLGKLADYVAVTYHESLAFFPKEKTYLTGNPVREGIMRGEREKACELFSLSPGRMTVFIFGGSSGARRINEAMLNSLNSLLEIREEVQFLHQTGESDYERVRKMYRDMGFMAMVVPFVHQMAEAYAVADVVVARAGATTLAELTALGKAAILIPYPHAAGHQEFNARKLLEIGGCRMLLDRELNGADGGGLAAHIKELAGSKELRAEMRSHSRALGRPEAAQRVADLVMNLASRKGNV